MMTILVYIAVYIGLFGAVFYFLGFFKKRQMPELIGKYEPKVSIIIPMHNEEKGISVTIENALALDYPKNKLQIIVVDDGSTDDCYKIACKFRKFGVLVVSKKNGGKGSAMNFGLKRATGEIIFTMDADGTYPEKNALKEMVYFFRHPDVYCVSPAIAVHNPKGFWQKIQQAEFLLGIFLRKAFASMDALSITPGAFSAYRKKFFDEYGGFDEDNITEDLEIALRIQRNNFVVENAHNAHVYTVCPDNFIGLLKQRRRWYVGLLRNLWKHNVLFSRKYGDLGVVVLPIVILSVFFSVILTFYLTIRTLLRLKLDLEILQGVNFAASSFYITKYAIQKYLLLFFSNPLTYLAFFFFVFLIGYMIFAKRNLKKYSNFGFGLIFFLLFFSILFVFWWTVSLIYVIFNRKVLWK